MTTTTNPRTVRTGMVEVSATSSAKRAALIGRRAEFRTYEGEVLVGTIERLDSVWPIIRFADGTWARGTRRVRLV